MDENKNSQETSSDNPETKKKIAQDIYNSIFL